MSKKIQVIHPTHNEMLVHCTPRRCTHGNLSVFDCSQCLLDTMKEMQQIVSGNKKGKN